MSVKTKCNILLFVPSVLVSLGVLADTSLALAENCIPHTTSLSAVSALLAHAQRPQPNETLGIVLVLGLCFGLVLAPVYYFYIRPRLKRDARDAGTPRSIPSISLQEAISVVSVLVSLGFCSSQYADAPQNARWGYAAVGLVGLLAWQCVRINSRLRRAKHATQAVQAPSTAAIPAATSAVGGGAQTHQMNAWASFGHNAFMAGGVIMFILGFAPAVVMPKPLGMGVTYIGVFDEVRECMRKGDAVGVAIFGFLMTTPLFLALLAVKGRNRAVFVIGGVLGVICLIASVSTYRLPVPMVAYPATLFMFQVASAGLLCGFFVKPNLLLPKN